MKAESTKFYSFTSIFDDGTNALETRDYDPASHGGDRLSSNNTIRPAVAKKGLPAAPIPGAVDNRAVATRPAPSPSFGQSSASRVVNCLANVRHETPSGLISLLAEVGLVDGRDRMGRAMIVTYQVKESSVHAILGLAMLADELLHCPWRHTRFDGDRLDSLAFQR